ncbi:hypothetical protein HK104_001438 [Borealophlyctis nickersoniae]|nr:hypothetical protein HK104_001438 [Borealophlyctis nickersoniae]
MLHNGTDWNKHRGVGATLLENWVEERAVAESAKLRNGGDMEGEREDGCDGGGRGGHRRSLVELSKKGHPDILAHASNFRDLTTTHRDAFRPRQPNDVPPPPRIGGSRGAGMAMGKRRQMIEAELMKLAVRDEDTEAPQAVDTSAKSWVSTHHADYDHRDYYGDMKELGSQPPSQDALAHFADPITFWSTQAITGTGATICSTTTTDLLHLGTPAECAECGSGSDCYCGTVQRSSVRQDGKRPEGDAPGELYHASAAGVKFGKHAAFTTPIEEYRKGDVKDL